MSIDISRKTQHSGLIRSNVVYRQESLLRILGVSERGLKKLIDEGLPNVERLGRKFFPGRLVVDWFESKVS